ncbi:MAG: hypothetical protein N3F67_04430 [Acidilobaceae archaeon]|nr:hypothetical protein [Acidilobaceae archaeon]
MGCWRLWTGLAVGLGIYGLELLASYYISSSPALPSFLVPLAPFESLFLAALALFFSTLLSLFTRSALISLSSVASVPAFLHIVGEKAVLEAAFLPAGAAAGALALAALFFRRIGEPIVDLFSDPRGWSPTALASAAVSLYAIDSFLGAPCELGAIFYASSLLSALLSSIMARGVAEALVLGAVSGLGPLGLTLVLLYSSFRPLPTRKCAGVDVGELVGYRSHACVNRSMFSTKDDAWRQEVMACSQRGRALLELQEPWILWVYGKSSRSVAEAIARRLGGFKIVSERDSSLKPRALRLAELQAEASSVDGDVWLDLPGDLQPEEIQALAFDVARRARRVIVTVPEVPWKEGLMPRGPARGVGVILAGLEDPAQAERAAQVLLPGSEGAREKMVEGSLLFGFPGCGSTLLAFKEDNL